MLLHLIVVSQKGSEDLAGKALRNFRLFASYRPSLPPRKRGPKTRTRPSMAFDTWSDVHKLTAHCHVTITNAAYANAFPAANASRRSVKEEAHVLTMRSFHTQTGRRPCVKNKPPMPVFPE